MARRLFVALMLGEGLGETVAARVREALGGHADVRLVGARELHATLFFLGAVDEPRQARLELALERSLPPEPPGELLLTGTGAYPGRARPRILWVGAREVAGAWLAPLQAAVARECVLAGFAAEERAWSPHVTVARVRGKAPPSRRLPERFFELDLGLRWQPPAVALVESVPGAVASSYRVLREFPPSGKIPPDPGSAGGAG